MTGDAQKPPPGWYPDASGGQRWWDGTQWTEHTNAPPQTVPARRKWWRKKRFIIPLALVAIFVALGVGGSLMQPTSDSGAASDEAPATADVGEAITVAGTRYTVESARRAQSVGESFAAEDAGGVYIVVELTIENLRQETRRFASEGAKVVTAEGKTYTADTDAQIAIASDGQSEPMLFEEMQPDVPKTGVLVYDVPKGAAKGSSLQVRDIFGRGEAMIDLGF